MAKQLLTNPEPTEVVESLLEEFENLKVQLDNAGSNLEKQPKTAHKAPANRLLSIHLHQLFHFLKVLNAIHTKVRFPDGLYAVKFTRLKTPEFNEYRAHYWKAKHLSPDLPWRNSFKWFVPFITRGRISCSGHCTF